jgi:hypothetical protein
MADKEISEELLEYHGQHIRTCKEFLTFCFQKQYMGMELSDDELGLKQLVLAYLNLAEMFLLEPGQKLYGKNEEKEDDGVIDLS